MSKSCSKVVKSKAAKKASETPIELSNALSMINHSSVCDLFLKVSTMKLVCYDIEKSRMFYYNVETQLYTEVGIKELAMKVTNTLKVYLSENMGLASPTDLQNYGKLIKSIGNFDFIKNVAMLLCGTCYDPTFSQKMDNCKSSMNFKNGVLNLKNASFRKRTADDYVTQCLDYDYTTEVNEDMKKMVLSLMLKICNDDNTVREDNLKWFGYCMTGETKQQKFLCTIGHSAQNGKSTLSKMFDSAFNIYSIKLDKQTFNKDFSKRHKQFALIKMPIRYIIIEELDRNKLDGDVLKDFVDGDKINNEIMYGTSEIIYLHCKLNLFSNNNVNFDTDGGIKRRGYSQEFTNKFLDAKHKDYKANTKGIHLKDESILDLIKTPAFRLAFCQIVLPYAQQYYKSG